MNNEIDLGLMVTECVEKEEIIKLIVKLQKELEELQFEIQEEKENAKNKNI